MKRLIVIVGLLPAAYAACAEETLLGSLGPLTLGGYGAFEAKTVKTSDDWNVLVGGKGGCVLNHALVIGGAGYGQVSELESEYYSIPEEPPITQELGLGYGGFYIEYILFSPALVHASVSALIGGGGVYDAYYDEIGNRTDGDAFFVAEPTAGVELNVARFFRINLSGGYRFTSGLDYANLTDENLRGPSASIAFKFGKF